MVIKQSKDIAVMNKSLFSLAKKRALVTGASRGIGYTLALGLADFGAEVTAVARTEKNLDFLAKAASKKKLDIKTAILDLTDKEKVTAFIKKEKPFSILVNNAGTSKHELALQVEEKNYDYVMELNVKSAFFTAQAVAKKLIAAKKSGSIITISSQMGQVGGVERSVYCCSKHAVEGFTKVFALEWAKHNIRVNTICPTFIVTPMTKPMLKKKKFAKSVLDNIALGRFGEVEDLVGPTVFLASNAASLITGSAILVDGGWTAK